MSFEYEIKNTDGLNYLDTIESKSINLVLTDPPYITSKQTGMNEHVKIVKNYEETGKNLKSEEDWKKFKTQNEWNEWMVKKKIPVKDREKNLNKIKDNYLKYGSIYGKKYAVTTDYGDWDNDFTMEQLELFIKHYYRVLRNGGTLIVFFDI